MKKFVNTLLNERKIILFLCFVITLLGMYSYYVIPKEENPKTNYPAAMMTAVYPGASPTEVEAMVTAKIEDAISDIPHIDYIASVSMNSASVVIVVFEDNVDWDKTKDELSYAIDKVDNKMPEMAQEIELSTDMIESTEFIISLSGEEYTREDLATYGSEIKDALENVDGVSRVDVEGLLDKQVNIVTDIQMLDLYKISIEDVIQLVAAQNVSIPSGSIEYESGEINVSTPAKYTSLNDIEEIIISGSRDSIGFVKINEIADVNIDHVQGYSYKQDGKNAILLTGYFQEDLNSVIIGENVRDKIEEIKEDFPSNITFHEVMYSPEDIDRSISSFIMSLIQSIILILVIVMLGVRFRNGIIVSIALPISIFITFIVMYMLKIEFQFISIAALIISLGILVDNAIVISESIQNKIDIGIKKRKAIRLAIKETAMPVLTSTITTVITFGILYFIPGAIGTTVSTIPTVVITALCASYLVAMLIIPVLASIFFIPHTKVLKKPKKKYAIERISKKAKKNDNLQSVTKKTKLSKKASKIKSNTVTKPSKLKEFFVSALEFGLGHKIITLTLAFATLGIAIFLVLQLGMSFFPYSDKEVIYINVTGETMNLGNTEDICDEIHKVLDKHPAVDHYTTSIGKQLPRFFLTIPTKNPADNFAQIMLQLDLEVDPYYPDNLSVGSSLQDELNSTITGSNIEVKYLEYSMPTEAKLVFKLKGDDLEELQEVSMDVQDALSSILGTNNIRDDYVEGSYEYVVNIDENKLTTHALLKYDVTKQINTALMGYNATQYINGGSELDIVVSANIESLDDLYNLPITSSITNNQVKLKEIAKVELKTAIATINRYNKERCITVLSDIDDGYTSFIIENTFKNDYQDNILPDGVSIEYLGEVKNMMNLIGNLGPIVGIALLLIYIVLLLQFRCFRKPLIILSTIPLSLIGCFLGLYIFNMDLQAMAILGIVALFGIVVNNGIILIEFMEVAIAKGMNVHDACVEAVSMRYRPIILSTTTTCVGLAPLIISGDPMSAPMASVLLFGLLFSTLLTMIVVPVMYAIVMKNHDAKQLVK